MQAFAAAQETPESAAGFEPTLRTDGNAGVGETRQRVPSHVSAIEPAGPPCAARIPTATQNVFEAQETPDRPLVRLGFGVWTIDHLVPSQVSASVPSLDVSCEEAFVCPTATQNVVDTHETDVSSGSGPGARGSGISLQAVPFHASASGARVVELS